MLAALPFYFIESIQFTYVSRRHNNAIFCPLEWLLGGELGGICLVVFERINCVRLRVLIPMRANQEQNPIGGLLRFLA